MYRVNLDPPVQNGFKKCTQTGKTNDTQFRRTGNDSNPINRNVTRRPLLLPRSVCSANPIWVSKRKVSFCGQMGHFQPLLLCFHFHAFVLAFVGKNRTRLNGQKFVFQKNVSFR